MKRCIFRTISIIITLFCLYYTIKNVHFKLLMNAFDKYSFISVILLSLVVVLLLILCTWRKQMMLGEGSFFTIFKGVLINYTANNIFPAKAGDVLHTFYLAKELNTTKTRLLHVVFWERFADLNIMLLAISLLVGFLDTKILYILMGLIFMMWIVIFILKIYPKILVCVLDKFPEGQIKNVLTIIHTEFHAIALSLLVRLFLVSFIVWGVTYIFYMYAFLYVADLQISYYGAFISALIVSVASLIPSSPGALGVFEASTIFGLSQFGVGKEEALAIAVLTHCVLFFIPIILMLFNKNFFFLLFQIRRIKHE